MLLSCVLLYQTVKSLNKTVSLRGEGPRSAMLCSDSEAYIIKRMQFLGPGPPAISEGGERILQSVVRQDYIDLERVERQTSAQEIYGHLLALTIIDAQKSQSCRSIYGDETVSFQSAYSWQMKAVNVQVSRQV